MALDSDSLTQNCAQRGGDRGGTSPVFWSSRKGAESTITALRCAVTPPWLHCHSLRVQPLFWGAVNTSEISSCFLPSDATFGKAEVGSNPLPVPWLASTPLALESK